MPNDIYNSFDLSLTKPPLFPDTVQSVNAFTSGVATEKIGSGDLASNINLVDGYLQSSNFVTGSAGWQIDADGNVEFNNGTFRGDLDAATFSGGSISFGKTAYTDDTNAGYWLGNVGGVGKLNIGASATKYLHYDGTDLTMLGGTITGSTIQTASSGYRVKMDSTNGLQLFNGATQVGILKADTGASVILDSDDNIYLTSAGNQMVYFTSGSIDLPSGMDITWAGTGKILAEAGGLKIEGAAGGNWGLRVEGNVFPNADNTHTCGASDKRWSGGWFEDISVDDITVNVSFSGCGSISGCAYKEVNLLTPTQKEEYEKNVKLGNERDKTKKYTDFELGDVLVFGHEGLKKSDLDTCNCVTAVAGEDGMPIVLGAEKIKVVGRVAINQFLVTSPVEGCARAWREKENPPTGTVIGQAMENKNDTGMGTIRAMIRKF